MAINAANLIWGPQNQYAYDPVTGQYFMAPAGAESAWGANPSVNGVGKIGSTMYSNMEPQNNAFRQYRDASMAANGGYVLGGGPNIMQNFGGGDFANTAGLSPEQQQMLAGGAQGWNGQYGAPAATQVTQAKEGNLWSDWLGPMATFAGLGLGAGALSGALAGGAAGGASLFPGEAAIGSTFNPYGGSFLSSLASAFQNVPTGLTQLLSGSGNAAAGTMGVEAPAAASLVGPAGNGLGPLTAALGATGATGLANGLDLGGGTQNSLFPMGTPSGTGLTPQSGFMNGYNPSDPFGFANDATPNYWGNPQGLNMGPEATQYAPTQNIGDGSLYNGATTGGNNFNLPGLSNLPGPLSSAGGNSMTGGDQATGGVGSFIGSTLPGALALAYAAKQGNTAQPYLNSINSALSGLQGNQNAIVKAATDPVNQNIAAGYGNLTQSLANRGVLGSSFGNTDLANFLAVNNNTLGNVGASALQGSMGLQGQLAGAGGALALKNQDIQNNLYGKAFSLLGSGLNPKSAQGGGLTNGGGFNFGGLGGMFNQGWNWLTGVA